MHLDIVAGFFDRLTARRGQRRFVAIEFALWKHPGLLPTQLDDSE
jgi:hypothetical protein